MKLAIDLDGVLAVFDKSYIKLLDWPLLPEPSDSWPDCWHWDEKAGVPAENIRAAWEAITASNRFWLDCEAYPTAKHDLQALGQAVVQGHDVYFLTSRPGRVAKLQSECWLRLHGYTFAPTVLICGGPETKGQLCQALHIDAIIDDRPENLVAAEPYLERNPFIFDRPWNRSATWPYLRRVSSVIEMLTQLGIAHAVGDPDAVIG